MRKLSNLFSSACVLLLLTTSFSFAGITIYTDKSQWQNNLSGIFETEDFSDDQLETGVSFVSSESGHINPAEEYYQDVLMSDSQNEPTTIWSFTTQITAFGGNWTLGGPGGSGNSLLVYNADTSEYIGSISNSYGGEFWGFISDDSLNSVQLTGAGGLHQQNYRLDDMVYSYVPEPATFSLLVVCGLTLIRRQ